MTVGDVKLIPLERVRMRGDHNEKGFFIHAVKEPIGVVIVSPQGLFARDVEGRSVPLETYLQQIRGLSDLLDFLDCGPDSE